MLNVIIPMAGCGKRFKDAGYAEPKPMINVLGSPMFEAVIDNLDLPQLYCSIHLIAQRSVVGRYQVPPHTALHAIDNVTSGAACTVLTIREIIDNEEELLICNCDQIVKQPLYMTHAIDYWRRRKADGGIICYYSMDANHSFVQFDKNGLVTRVAEKKVISNFATVGIYYYRYGRDFVSSADRMIEANDRHSNEYYIAPVYNYLLGFTSSVKILT
jgi:dTDP-glucose pyrophosphorylase